MTVTIATWNIAGARPIKSAERFDYAPEDIGYFTEQLRAIDADVICLQETHLNKDRSVAKEIAEQLGYHIHEAEMSPSHVDAAYSLGNAILYKEVPKSLHNFLFPYPFFKLLLPGGRVAARHNKGFQIAEFSFGMVVNMQMLPLGFLGTPYDSPDGLLFSEEMERTLLSEVRSPSIICGDFNFREPKTQYAKLLANSVNALPDVPTRPEEKKTDFIFVSPEFRVQSSRVIETNSDHFLCVATLESK